MAKKIISKKNYLCMRKDTSRRFTISAQGLEILKKDKGEFAKIKVLAESDEYGKFPDSDFQKKEIKPIEKKKAESEEIIEVESKVITNGNSNEPTGENAEEKKAESEEATNLDDTGGLSEESKSGGNKGELDFTEEDPGDDEDID